MPLSDLSILIADDNEMNRWLLAEQLQQWCLDVTSACDGQEAWRFLQLDQYSLVFLDVNMPGLNGFELVKKIRAGSANQSTPVIAVTAHVQSYQRHTLISAGFNDCLIKPLMLSDLQRAISHWCESSNGLNCHYYATAVLDRAERNADLAKVFLEKLFQEAPVLFVNLASTLDKQQVQLASDLAHKLHGSFCFYGFADFRGLAESLEASLLDGNLPKAQQQFRLLAAKFDDLSAMQGDLLLQLTQ